MNELTIFQAALGLTEPWKVSTVVFDQSQGRLEIELDFARGSKLPCPECGCACAVHDSQEQSWRHLNFFQHETYLKARTPRVDCPEHGVKTVTLPWARERSGFTLLFEALVVTYARSGMTTNAIGRLVGEHDTRMWRILEHYVDGAHEQLDLSDITELGVDETSRAKGHTYVTIFVDMIRSRVVYATQGKDHETVTRFRADFEQHGAKADNIREFSMDMSQAFIKGVQEQFPDASLTFDRFHVMELANDAVGEVRRQEQKSSPELTGTHLLWLKNEKNLDDQQLADFEQLRNSTLKTARAWRIKDTLRQLYEQPPEHAEQYLRRWYFWATHSRLKPIVKLAKTIKTHWDGVLRWFKSGLSQGLVEGINSLIQAAKARARGFRSVRKMVVTIYLVAGKLDAELATMLPKVTHAR